MHNKVLMNQQHDINFRMKHVGGFSVFQNNELTLTKDAQRSYNTLERGTSKMRG